MKNIEDLNVKNQIPLNKLISDFKSYISKGNNKLIIAITIIFITGFVIFTLVNQSIICLMLKFFLQQPV